MRSSFWFQVVLFAVVSAWPTQQHPAASAAPELVDATANRTGAAVVEDDDDTDGEPNKRSDVVVSGIRVEATKSGDFLGYTRKGYSLVKPDVEVRVVFFGTGFTEITAVTFTRDGSCQDSEIISESQFSIMTGTRLVVVVSFLEEGDDQMSYYPCIAERPERGKKPVFVEIKDGNMHISTIVPPKEYYMPLPLQISVVAVLLTLSGLFSGLNLGLMSLTPQELKLIEKSGSKAERKYAATILPVRKRGNFLLCTLLIGNVFVNSAISILMDDMTGSGLIALLASSAGIVVFGEIFPQAVCTRKGLAVGAKTILITKIFMLLTFAISFPISLLLDRILGQEVVSFDRKRLVELIKLQCDSKSGIPLLEDEFKIALGALQIWDKTVSEVMTKIDDVFMLPTTTFLNTRAVAEILKMGYTRIPVYEKIRNNVVSLLFVKDLALLDPEDNLSVVTVCNYHQHMVRFVTEDTPLRILLDEFKKGDYHLAMVHRVVSTDDADPSYELVGLITLEDIFEEILQAEIVDETDAVTDNVHRKKRCGRKTRDMSYLMEGKSPSCVVSIQLQLVTVQWLTTRHTAFSNEYISTGILEKLVRQRCRKVETSLLTDLSDVNAVLPRVAKLYTKGEYSDKVILILEGRVIVTIGQDGMTFEAGPWHVFGVEMLENLVRCCVGNEDVNRSCSSLPSDRPKQNFGFIPDFSAVVRNECTFVEITANDWLLAYKSTLLSRRNSGTEMQKNAVHMASRSSLDDKITTSLITPQWSMKKNGGGKPRSFSESEQCESTPLNSPSRLSGQSIVSNH